MKRAAANWLPALLVFVARDRRLAVGVLAARRQVPAAEAVGDREGVLGQPARARERRLVHVQGGARRVRDRLGRSRSSSRSCSRASGGVGAALMPYAIAASAVPIIAFAPITNAWFGVLNPHSKWAIAGVLCFFPVLVNTLRGLHLGAAGGDRADALLRRGGGRHLPARPHPDRAAVHLRRAQGRDRARDDRRDRRRLLRRRRSTRSACRSRTRSRCSTSRSAGRRSSSRARSGSRFYVAVSVAERFCVARDAST